MCNEVRKMLHVRLLVDLDTGRRKGDVVDVAEGYGRTYLIAHGFAELAEEEGKEDEWAPRKLTKEDALNRNIVLQEFRRQMYHGGTRTWTIRGLNRVFDVITKSSQDSSGNASLESWQFREAINKFGVFLSDSALDTLMRAFDVNDDGLLSHQEFLSGLRGPMNPRRFHICERAWDAILSRHGGNAAVDMQVALGTVESHPLVRSGQATEDQVNDLQEESLAYWTAGHCQVNKDAFMAHFTDISATVDSDEVFVQMVERQFGIREEEESDSARALVENFKHALFTKVHEKAQEGVTESRTLLDAFRLVNSDSMGQITLAEFSAAMDMFGLAHDDETLEAVFQHFDESRDNQISYREFVDAMTRDP